MKFPHAETGADPKLSKMVVVVLAAGNSSRLGRPKQAVRFAGECLLVKQLKLALSISAKVICVLGSNALAMKSLVPRSLIERVVFINNTHWATGMSSSIASSISAIEKTQIQAYQKDDSISAALFLLVDQWQLNESNLKGLLEGWQNTNESSDLIHVAGESDKFTPPVIFPQRYFERLSLLTGESGAKPIIKENIELCRFYPIPEAFIDLDTPEQLAALQSAV